MARRFASVLVPLAVLVTTPALASGVVISQVYGGGGNSGAPYANDFVELFNTSDVTVSVTGWSVQYASATGNSWQVTPLSGSIPAHAFFLVAESSGGAVGVPLPTADVAGAIALSSTAGKVALATSTTPLAVACPGPVADFVGYGVTANCFEGSGPAPAPSNTAAALRAGPCVDANDNAAEFASGPPNPRNSATSPATCAASAIGYAVLQFPQTAGDAACAAPGGRTTVYGQVYIAGVTPSAGPISGLIAQLGVGPSGTDPATAAGWSWVTGAFNAGCCVGSNNNNEYQQTMPLVHGPGTYDYAWRFSYLGGTFVYADGPVNGTNDGYSPADAGKLTVTSDTVYCDPFEQ